MNLLKFRRKNFASLKKRKSTKRKSTKRKSTKRKSIKKFSIRKNTLYGGGGKMAVLSDDDVKQIKAMSDVDLPRWLKDEITVGKGMGVSPDEDQQGKFIRIYKGPGTSSFVNETARPTAYEFLLNIYNNAVEKNTLKEIPLFSMPASSTKYVETLQGLSADDESMRAEGLGELAEMAKNSK